MLDKNNKIPEFYMNFSISLYSFKNPYAQFICFAPDPTGRAHSAPPHSVASGRGLLYLLPILQALQALQLSPSGFELRPFVPGLAPAM